MTRIGDPGLRYMTRMAEVWGRLAMRAASAEIIPLDYEQYGRQIAMFLKEMARESDSSEARRAAAKLSQAGRAARRIMTHPSRVEAMAPAGRDRLNEALLSAERALCDEKGLPDRPWFKHLIYGCRYTYAPLLFPGFTEAVEEGDMARAHEREKVLATALRRSAETIEAGLSAEPRGAPQ